MFREGDAPMTPSPVRSISGAVHLWTIIAALLGLVACAVDVPSASSSKKSSSVPGVLYFKDEATSLCFATFYDRAIAHVPCTPEVERMVAK